MAVHDGEIVTVPAYPVAAVIDATGAGDLFASGFLLALARGRQPIDSVLHGAGTIRVRRRPLNAPAPRFGGSGNERGGLCIPEIDPRRDIG